MTVARCIICGGVGKIPTHGIAGIVYVCGYPCMSKMNSNKTLNAALDKEKRKQARSKKPAPDEEE